MSTLNAASNQGGTLRPVRGKWGTGPKVLTWIGSVILGIALVAAGFGVAAFASMLPLSVVTADGGPGPEALGGAEIPGEATFTATEGQRLVVWEAVSHSSSFALQRDDISVESSSVEVSVSVPSVSGSSSHNSIQARTVAEFVVPADGQYTVAVDGVGGGNFIVAEGDSFPAFMTGIFGTIFLWFIAIGGGIIGTFLLVGGIIWGVLRSQRPTP